jgi:hypothetical protein
MQDKPGTTGIDNGISGIDFSKLSLYKFVHIRYSLVNGKRPGKNINLI